MRCRAVVVAASACESARLLLNSKSPRFSNGLANASGLVGRYLTDTRRLQRSAATFPRSRHAALQQRRHRRHAPLRALVAVGDKQKDFPRGYHIEIGGGFGMPQLGIVRRAVRAATKATARR